MWIPESIFGKKNIILGVCGSIAAFKSCTLASTLAKSGARVRTILTSSACKFVGPLSFSSLTDDAVYTDEDYWSLKVRSLHIELGRWADVVVVAPATANTLAKVANGMADNLLTSTILGSNRPTVLVPAMNVRMYDNKATQENLKKLSEYGYIIVEPDVGHLADGEVGRGRFPETETILFHIARAITPQRLVGRKIIVTAGPTREFIDDVRFISNPSSGKMGYALAEAFAIKGADVTLLSGPVELDAPPGVHIEKFESVSDLMSLMERYVPSADAVVMSAAVGDFTAEKTQGKLKRQGELTLKLSATPDVVAYFAQRYPKVVYLGFAAGEEDVVMQAQEKMRSKKVDAVFANRIDTPQTGFGTDTNSGWLITKDGVVEAPLQTKVDLAWWLSERVSWLIEAKSGISL
jgi:phosphopantothenoylcysteine decarboxylase/phosphopantothenate--cysteine ligase